ncbi:MAG TPA: hypothetical protein VIT67_06890 [Povalibacter sp.]
MFRLIGSPGRVSGTVMLWAEACGATGADAGTDVCAQTAPAHSIKPAEIAAALMELLIMVSLLTCS